MSESDFVSNVPQGYVGTPYFQVMSDISQKRSTKRYLEIGVNTGYLLQHIHAELGVCVDPSFRLSESIMNNKKALQLWQMTSDAFFSDAKATAALGSMVDLAFLDGMHVFEFLLRDFFNTENICSRGGLIAMHDCMPLNAEMAHRIGDRAMEIGQGTSYPNYWTGDVWKIIPILQKYRPELKLVCVGAPPTGIVFVTGLNPRNTVLRDNYLAIVDEFARMPNDLESISAMYDTIEIVSPEAIIAEFDHSLYFAV